MPKNNRFSPRIAKVGLGEGEINNAPLFVFLEYYSIPHYSSIKGRSLHYNLIV